MMIGMIKKNTAFFTTLVLLATLALTTVSAIPTPPSSSELLIDTSKQPQKKVSNSPKSSFGRTTTTSSKSEETTRSFGLKFRCSKSAAAQGVKNMLQQVKGIEGKVMRLLVTLPPPTRRRSNSESSLIIIHDHESDHESEHNLEIEGNNRNLLIHEIEQNLLELENMRKLVAQENDKDQDWTCRELVKDGLTAVYGIEQLVRLNFAFNRRLGFLGRTYRVVETTTHDVFIQPINKNVVQPINKNIVQPINKNVVKPINKKVITPIGIGLYLAKEQVVGFGQSIPERVGGIGESVKQQYEGMDVRTGVTRVVEGTRGVVLAIPENLKTAGEQVTAWFGGIWQSFGQTSFGHNVQQNLQQAQGFFQHQFSELEEKAGMFNVFGNHGRVKKQVQEYEEKIL